MTKILYVEDNDDNIFMLVSRLQRRGCEMIVARDGEQGVAMARQEVPDVILMDLGLPVLDGWEATQRLQASPATRKTPIIVLTAHAKEGDREKAVSAGADDYDTEPAEIRRLTARIEDIVGKGKEE